MRVVHRQVQSGMPQGCLDHSRILALRHQERAKAVAEHVEAETLDLVAV